MAGDISKHDDDRRPGRLRGSTTTIRAAIASTATMGPSMIQRRFGLRPKVWVAGRRRLAAMFWNSFFGVEGYAANSLPLRGEFVNRPFDPNTPAAAICDAVMWKIRRATA